MGGWRTSPGRWSGAPSTTKSGPTPQMPKGSSTGEMPMAGMTSMTGMTSQSVGEMAMPGMGMIDRVEGRLAFLRAELKITDKQTLA